MEQQAAFIGVLILFGIPTATALVGLFFYCRNNPLFPRGYLRDETGKELKMDDLIN